MAVALEQSEIRPRMESVYSAVPIFVSMRASSRTQALKEGSGRKLLRERSEWHERRVCASFDNESRVLAPKRDIALVTTRYVARSRVGKSRRRDGLAPRSPPSHPYQCHSSRRVAHRYTPAPTMLEAKLSEAALLKRLLDGTSSAKHAHAPATVRPRLTRRDSGQGACHGRELRLQRGGHRESLAPLGERAKAR